MSPEVSLWTKGFIKDILCIEYQNGVGESWQGHGNFFWPLEFFVWKQEKNILSILPPDVNIMFSVGKKWLKIWTEIMLCSRKTVCGIFPTCSIFHTCNANTKQFLTHKRLRFNPKTLFVLRQQIFRHFLWLATAQRQRCRTELLPLTRMSFEAFHTPSR